MRYQPTFISRSNSTSLTLIPEQMNGYVLSGTLWPNAVTVRPKFGYVLVIITSGSNLLEIIMSKVTQMTRARNSSTSKSSIIDTESY
jgi:hypothetical protein